jgi:hypothetical protein
MDQNGPELSDEDINRIWNEVFADQISSELVEKIVRVRDRMYQSLAPHYPDELLDRVLPRQITSPEDVVGHPIFTYMALGLFTAPILLERDAFREEVGWLRAVVWILFRRLGLNSGDVVYIDSSKELPEVPARVRVWTQLASAGSGVGVVVEACDRDCPECEETTGG